MKRQSPLPKAAYKLIKKSPVDVAIEYEGRTYILHPTKGWRSRAMPDTHGGYAKSPVDTVSELA